MTRRNLVVVALMTIALGYVAWLSIIAGEWRSLPPPKAFRACETTAFRGVEDAVVLQEDAPVGAGRGSEDAVADDEEQRDGDAEPADAGDLLWNGATDEVAGEGQGGQQERHDEEQ